MEDWIIHKIREEMDILGKNRKGFYGAITFRLNYQAGSVKNINVIVEKSILPEGDGKNMMSHK